MRGVTQNRAILRPPNRPVALLWGIYIEKITHAE